MTNRPLIVLGPDAYRRTPWKNGGGVTVDIADAYRPGSEPGDWNAMVWRFGRTTITQPGPFSDLSGYDRLQAVIAGRGLVLDVAGEDCLSVEEPFRPVRFPGEWAITSRLEDGPVEVLNLIGDRETVTIDLVFLSAGSRVGVRSGEHVLYAHSGPADVMVEGHAERLAADHALCFSTDTPIAVELASGNAALATITQRQS